MLHSVEREDAGQHLCLPEACEISERIPRGDLFSRLPPPKKRAAFHGVLQAEELISKFDITSERRARRREANSLGPLSDSGANAADYFDAY
jgi:hypothetical protein